MLSSLTDVFSYLHLDLNYDLQINHYLLLTVDKNNTWPEEQQVFLALIEHKQQSFSFCIILRNVRFEVFLVVTMKNGVFWGVSRVALVRTDVWEELSPSFIRATRIGELGTTLAVNSNRRSVLRLQVTAVLFLVHRFLSPKTSVLIRATQRNIPEDTILRTWKCCECTHIPKSHLIHHVSFSYSSLMSQLPERI
jgi:hypothetical protein